MSHLYKVNSIEDFEDYFKIKSDKTAILWSGFSSAPDKEKLFNHFSKLIKEPNQYLYYLKDDDTNVVIGYDLMVKIDDTTVESAGHSILSQFQRHGYGNLLLSLFVTEAKILGFKRSIAWISENNIGSIKNFQNNGFIKTEKYCIEKLAAFDREDKFYMYERTL